HFHDPQEHEKEENTNDGELNEALASGGFAGPSCPIQFSQFYSSYHFSPQLDKDKPHSNTHESRPQDDWRAAQVARHLHETRPSLIIRAAYADKNGKYVPVPYG